MLKPLALIFLLFFGLGGLHPARSDVLVVVNDNSIDSPQLGLYYAQQRDIDPVNIVHVRVPNQFIVNWNDFRSLRDIVRVNRPDFDESFVEQRDVNISNANVIDVSFVDNWWGQ